MQNIFVVAVDLIAVRPTWFKKFDLIEKPPTITINNFLTSHLTLVPSTKRKWPAPMAHSYRLELVTWRYQVWSDIGHRGYAYTVHQTVQMSGVYSAAYGTVHYEEPSKSFEIRVGHSSGFGLSSVAILPWLCRKRRKAILTHKSKRK